jgi:hypothetical protein
MTATLTESPAEALERIQNGYSKNDEIVILAFADAGIDPDKIEPRRNVLTFRAWRATDRRVAKGATSVSVTTWIPIGGHAGQFQLNADQNKPSTGDVATIKANRPRVRPKTAHLFHVSQTIPADAPKGTRPAAWNNGELVKAGTYDDEA